MQQPSFFDKVHRVHFLRIDKDGSTTEFEALRSEEEVGFAEELAITCTKTCKVWQDKAGIVHEVYVFTE